MSNSTAMTRTEVKHRAQDVILAGIANELDLMAETELTWRDGAEYATFLELQAQAARVARFLGVDSYAGVIHEGKPVARSGIWLGPGNAGGAE